MQVLPDRAADRARNSHVVLEAAPSAFDCDGDEITHDSTSFRPKPSVVVEVPCGCTVSNDHSTKTTIANENVCTQSENEPRETERARSRYGHSEIARRRGIVQHIRRTPNAE